MFPTIAKANIIMFRSYNESLFKVSLTLYFPEFQAYSCAVFVVGVVASKRRQGGDAPYYSLSADVCR